ncbi:uncharacterized protein PRCAT00000988001 [Priceomyces carsonii]|uniref:uncharacterized protein n=1 Tax=Priceomyces carsonii TaxID=28549 RepID=UPI002ED7EFF8|nr:unnamed protein product [Priceomyces carsonii]
MIPEDVRGNAMLRKSIAIMKKYASFIGPGIMVSVAYMDPGNYSTAVSSGAMYEYKLLFVIFMSNLFAVVLQCLCIKLGTVTGLDLAEFCRLHLSSSVNISLYVCAELAIIFTDLAEVVGTAISLEIIFGIPLTYGVLVTILDVLVVLIAYHKDGTMRQTRLFEFLVSLLVFATCICFILELFKCQFESGSLRKIVDGFLPINKQIFKEKNALFLSCGIVGSTVMPHSLYLGSALVQSRLKEYDVTNGYLSQSNTIESEDEQEQTANRSKIRRLTDNRKLKKKYKPSYEAIKYCLSYSYTELVLSLFLIAVFVNAAILIVSGTTLFHKPDAEDADLLSIYEMLSYYISPAAGMIFALSMLFSGQSAGIVCTMAGQIVSEGFINWSFEPWVRRLITRIVAIIPVLVVISILGREGISKIINSSQVALSLILPVVSAPLIWFTCKKEYMTVDNSRLNVDENSALLNDSSDDRTSRISFENGSFLTIAGTLTWLIITALNIYLIIAFAKGEDI